MARARHLPRPPFPYPEPRAIPTAPGAHVRRPDDGLDRTAIAATFTAC